MEINTDIVVSAAGAAMATALLFTLWSHKRTAEQQERLTALTTEHHEALARVRAEAQARIDQSRAEFEAEFQRKLKDHEASQMTIAVHPFVKTQKNDGWFAKESAVDVGYKYQLMIQGIPCFASHEIVIESSHHKELNEERMKILLEKAEQLAEAAISFKGGRPHAAAINVAKAVLTTKA